MRLERAAKTHVVSTPTARRWKGAQVRPSHLKALPKKAVTQRPRLNLPLRSCLSP